MGDASALSRVLKDFFAQHPDFHPDAFLGNSAFNSANLYEILINEFHFSKALIPYNHRNESTLKEVDCYPYLRNELSTIHPKPETFNSEY